MPVNRADYDLYTDEEFDALIKAIGKAEQRDLLVAEWEADKIEAVANRPGQDPERKAKLLTDAAERRLNAAAIREQTEAVRRGQPRP